MVHNGNKNPCQSGNNNESPLPLNEFYNWIYFFLPHYPSVGVRFTNVGSQNKSPSSTATLGATTTIKGDAFIPSLPLVSLFRKYAFLSSGPQVAGAGSTADDSTSGGGCRKGHLLLHDDRGRRRRRRRKREMDQRRRSEVRGERKGG